MFFNAPLLPRMQSTAELEHSPTLAAETARHEPPAERDGTDGVGDHHSDTIRAKTEPASTLPPPSAPTSPAVFTFHAIGHLSSCFKLKFATPRQGTITPSSRASLTLLPHIDASALVGLSSYSHCWLLFVFHHNTNRSVPTLLHPPRLPHTAPKVGLFATRSPVRFNPIGLSLCRLEGVSVAERRVELSSVDLIEGTPVLDIKPYHPCDQPPAGHAPAYPAWLLEPHDTLSVSIDDGVREQLVQWAAQRRLERYNDCADALCALIVEMASFDPRPPFIRQKHEGRQAVFGMRVDAVNVLYWVDDDARHATVCGVELMADAAAAEGERAVDERERMRRHLERVGRVDGRRSLRLTSEQAKQKRHGSSVESADTNQPVVSRPHDTGGAATPHRTSSSEVG